MSQNPVDSKERQRHPHWQAECSYLEAVNKLLKESIERETNNLVAARQSLIKAQEELQENMPYSAEDTDKSADTSQYLNIVYAQAASYQVSLQKLRLYQRLEGSPYFGRIDFTEKGLPRESFYIGRGTLRDPESFRIMVYDWRAPVSSLFYRAGLGPASYQAPDGEISGEVDLKRQYDIKKGSLNFFFDTEVNIHDEMLIRALSQNASAKMRDIVETIQKEQDMIIRDSESDLLMVQGTAGSGKTSVALHRVAYLMYQSLARPLAAHNVLVISPHEVFSTYISQVLPDLGEENINSLTFEILIAQYLTQGQQMLTRAQQLETLLITKSYKSQKLARDTAAFKTSAAFCTILERYARYYEHKIYRFPDIYYNGSYIATRQELKEESLRDRLTIPFTKRLEQIKKRLLQKLHQAKRKRLPELEEFVTNYPDHQLEIRSFARLLSYKHSAGLLHMIMQIDQIDFTALYRSLFVDPVLFYNLARGLTLPDNIDEILAFCRQSGDPQILSYEDALAKAYLKILLDGTKTYPDIKQIVVDEFQDYGPLHYALLNRIFPKASYTIIGDIHQSVANVGNLSLFEDIKKILNKKKSSLAVLRQSFRSSYEISLFSQQFLTDPNDTVHFERHGTPPIIRFFTDQNSLDRGIIEYIRYCRSQGYESIALICKTMAQAKALYKRLRQQTPLRLITENSTELVSGALVLPVYLAKGLEFDSVLLYQTNAENYNSPDDRRLLYIGATRALHHLALYYSGRLSPLVNHGSINQPY